MKFIISLFLSFFIHSLFGQSSPESEYYRRMDYGQQLMIAGDYQAAQTEFMFVLENMAVIPTDLTYLFGRNSFHLSPFTNKV